MTLVERLARALADGAADHTISLLGGDEIYGSADAATPAAVLVPVTDRPEPGVILTQRTDTLRHHAGQIAFPGGRIDPGDADPAAAALREAEEEIGLPRSAVTVIGEADHYRTGTGYHITPVIGVVAPDLVYRPNPAEVADIFEVPLTFLLDVANHVENRVEWQGRDRRYYEISWPGRRIWGVTAGIIVNLSRRLRWNV